MPDGRFDDLLRRRDRRRRNQRIAAGVVGIAVFVAAVWIVTSGGAFNRTQPAIQPTPSPTAIPGYHHNGEILVLKDGAFTQIDPVTGNVVTGNGVELPEPGSCRVRLRVVA